MNRLILLTALSTTLLSVVSCSEGYVDTPTDFKAIEYNKIKGATKLGQPYFLRDSQGNPLYVEKNGTAYPAIFDYNNDGKEDLLIGEFGMGKNANLLAFENIGEHKKPIYNPTGSYLTDLNNENIFINGH